MLGDKNLLVLLAEAATQFPDAERAKNLLLARLAAYRGSAALMDDETFFLIRNQK